MLVKNNQCTYKVTYSGAKMREMLQTLLKQYVACKCRSAENLFPTEVCSRGRFYFLKLDTLVCTIVANNNQKKTLSTGSARKMRGKTKQTVGTA